MSAAAGVDARAAIRAAMRRTVACYRPHDRKALRYVRGKFVYDVVYRQVAERAPFGSPVVDFGCGRGQTLLLVAQLEPAIEGVGIDWDEAKLALARRACAGFPRLRFEAGDVCTTAIPSARTLLMLDMLHYHAIEQQDEILRRAARALTDDGVLYLRDVDDARGWRSYVNRWQEIVNRALAWNQSRMLVFRPMSEIVRVLEREGLRVQASESFGAMPLANVLLEARRA